jgi:hypothetical protein
LKRKTAEVSSGHFHDKVAPIAKAARKDSAVHVSLSSDSLVKQPGTLRPVVQSTQLRLASGKAGETRTPHIRRGDANMAIKSMAGCSVTV